MADNHPKTAENTPNGTPLPLPKRALILGAGWLGESLAADWSARGVAVTTVSRSPRAPARGAASRRQHIACDLATIGNVRDHASDVGLPSAFAEHDVVVAMVAPNGARGDDHVSTYPSCARGAVRIARTIGARALCWISSTGVYGYQDGREVTEASPRSATGGSNLALSDAEDAILAAVAPTLSVGVLRVAGLYGPGRDPAPRYRNPQSLAGRGAHYLNLAWQSDVHRAIETWLAAAAGAATTAAPPLVLNVADGSPVTLAECARLVAEAEGRVPMEPPASLDGRDVPPLRSNQRIRVDALRALGWTPQVPDLRAGLRMLGYKV
jgi:nucleoside-diphosphate-sugar epimerase